MIDFKVTWSDTGITRKTHFDFMNDFGTAFYSLVTKSVDKCAKSHNTGGDNDGLNQYGRELIQEIVDHAYLCQLNASKFHGRQELIEKVGFETICVTELL